MIPVFSLPADEAPLWQRLENPTNADPETARIVAGIIEDVRAGGDEALLEATARFDGVRLERGGVAVPKERLAAAWNSLGKDLRGALELAARRIEAFHARQMPASLKFTDEMGVRLAHRWRPLESVGIYVPGGTAAYPSTVLMNAIPARVAGVGRIVAVTPPTKSGEENSVTLAALFLAGVTEVYQVGGAQAVAALALGTRTIARVNKIVGPGNRYVAEAKRQLYGTVSIDMVAGPSEVMIFADKTAQLGWVAADMLAQAEHDADAQAIAVLIGRRDAEDLVLEIERQTTGAMREGILRRAFKDRGAIVMVPSVEAAVRLANRKAPEHIEIMTADPRAAADGIVHAGSIFLGPYSPEAIGDYNAGPNHVLPTGGTARFSSALSVMDFVRATQYIECSPDALEALGHGAIRMANAEGLQAHARSVAMRMRTKPTG